MSESFIADHPNAKLIAKLYKARTESDWDGIASCFSDDAIWQYPGHNPLARDYHGPDDIVTFFQGVKRLTDQSFGVNPAYIMANDDVAMVYELPTGRRRGVTMSWDSMHLYEIKDGKITYAKIFQRVQYSLDAYWWNGADAPRPREG
ncbi:MULTISPECIES: nuclear transport factor 2 family protein [unclassified Rhizobium]|uniref:nuclear transport factor 2 family protein n=1 Tax=unclassified Rhizobium TaxID=2613769 RepID=UPI001ADCFAE6|nr:MULTISPECIES: nuclear transport factor 2 family protein [unclassified Rhizobium]MBO9123761.1 nuclear transport factor 2 family protein [Rhizobium sp. 16-488-2b]MBO9174293.1 nuclear transport factor 2 family protein [Rhizobium sp. 16-488-2a]